MTRTIAHLGTFDVQNYGDLLFPLVLEHALARRDIKLVHVSPLGGSPVWEDCVTSIGAEQFYSGLWREMDAFIIGGGNIIHALPSLIPPYCGQPRLPLLAYPSLWLTAGMAAARSGVPLVWNGPGVPQALEARLLPEIASLLRSSAYVAVRDTTSRELLLAAAPEAEIEVIPDTALALPEIWSKEGLRGAFVELFERQAIAVPRRSCVFHVKERYKKKPLTEIAADIAAFCQTHDTMPIFLAIGPVHGDDSIARELASIITVPSVVIDAPRSLKEVTCLLACADGYVGSSLHGFLIASAYSVPALLVASEKVHKFRGCLDALGLADRLVEEWSHSSSSFVPDIDPQPGLASCKARLDAHWTRLIVALDVRRAPVAGAEDLLEATFQLVESSGQTYLTDTILHLQERNRVLTEGSWFARRRYDALRQQHADEQKHAAERFARKLEAAIHRGEKLRQEAKTLRREQRHLRAQAEEQSREVAAAAEREAWLVEDLRIKTELIDQLQSVLQAIERSRLWRLAQRLRRIASFVRPVHQGTFEGVQQMLAEHRQLAPQNEVQEQELQKRQRT